MPRDDEPEPDLGCDREDVAILESAMARLLLERGGHFAFGYEDVIRRRRLSVGWRCERGTVTLSIVPSPREKP